MGIIKLLAILSCPEDDFKNVKAQKGKELLLPNIAEGHRPCPPSTYGIIKETGQVFESKFQHYLTLVSDRLYIIVIDHNELMNPFIIVYE